MGVEQTWEAQGENGRLALVDRKRDSRMLPSGEIDIVMAPEVLVCRILEEGNVVLSRWRCRSSRALTMSGWG